jgi:hypothetical protein
MTDPLHRDPLHAHSHLVDLVAAAGVAPPDEWVRLRVRLKLFHEVGTPMLSRLTHAVIDGPVDADIAALRAAAYAEQQANAKVNSAVRAAVLRRMRETYASAVVDNYGKMAAIFDAAAAKFAATAQLVAVEASGESMVDHSATGFVRRGSPPSARRTSSPSWCLRCTPPGS